MKESVLEKFALELLEGLKAVKGFAVEQIPEVLRQVLAYGMVEDAVIVISCAVILVLLWKLHFSVKEIWDKNEYSAAPIAYVPMSLIAVASFFAMGSYLLDALKIISAPKLYLLEYAAHMAKGCGH